MKKTAIVTDSNSGILQKEAENLGIFVVPMPFTVDGEEYFEEITMNQDEFFACLERGADVKTSQPSRAYLEELWGKLLNDYEEVLYIPMSSGLSQTCENAQIYAKEYGGKVKVVDNKRISVTQKMSVLEAVKLLEQGKSADEIKTYLEESSGKASIYIMLNVLKYLKKGGRISPAAATLGDMVKLKPILFSRGGAFEKFAIVFSLNQAKRKMIAQIESEMKGEFKEEYEAGKMVVSVAHTQNELEALKFREEIQKYLPKLRFRFVDPLSLSVSCHIGAGALAIAVCIDNTAE